MGLDITFGGAALAGLLSFFSPCILPMVPFYLSYMAGLSMQELHGRDGGPTIPRDAQIRLILSAVAFALGVTTIFVLLGLGATAAGAAFAQWKTPLSYVAAAILAVFGLHFLGVIRIPFLYREARVEAKTDPSTMAGAYVMGLAFGFGWTPCIGPVLATILGVAASRDTVGEGAALLAVYAAGLGVPFLVAGAFSRPFIALMRRFRAQMGLVEKITGGLLVVTGVAFLTGGIERLSFWLIETFPILSQVG